MEYELGQKIAFYCGGRHRGGHVAAFAEVTKINRKTVQLTECKPSYSPGQIWVCNKEWLIQNLVSRGMHSSDYNIGLEKIYGPLTR